MLRWGLAERRARAARRAAPGPLADVLAVDPPAPTTPLTELPLLALDLETTGLDPEEHRVLSAGWVPVDGRRVVLGGARRFVVSDAGDVGRSATIHGITDDALASGVPLADVLAELLEALRGRALLAHFARVETGFVDAACTRLWGAGLPVPVVDTLELERRAVVGPWGREVGPGALRLWGARERYGLPVYSAHEALTDALACAELYLAQTAGRQGATLRDVQT
ncbi:DNA polymerase III subunit epsilon [Phycicoccus sp. CSK15P-2]|nr:DNA polymerase III subunit epsilon [Phycicoccus sp. CSK15P-2]